jgi:UDP-N-acetylmuramoyl-tripeptide--D-alanyl-D-alanine ligase
LTNYLLFIQFLLFLMSVVFLRHLIWRARYFIHVFQLSGYKLNEFWSWMKDHWNSRVLTATHALSNLLLLLFLVFVSQWFTPTAPAVIIAVFMIAWYLPVSDYSRREKKPLAFTPRVKRLMLPLLLVTAFLPLAGVRISFFLTNMLPDVYIMAFGWVLAIMLVPFFVMLSGLIMKPVERSIQQGFVRQAQKKLASMPGLKIIGITGSYGKTSTKFALATMLSERYSVCFTPGSFNTPMGICKVINNDLQSHHQIMILEMGARYRGNIAELCRIAHPNIAVLTNIGKAHLETFGSQEAIAETKGELLEALKPGETAVVNADDVLVMGRVALRDDISVISAGLQGGDFRATEIRYDAKGCSFTVTDPAGEQVRVETRLLGHHNVHNVLLGFAVGSALGLRLPTLALAASRIEPVEHRLELKQAGNYSIIDDAFNSNPVGARNAIDVLASFDGGRRIVVTPGMVELGDSEIQENRSFGEHIGRSGIDQVILVGEHRAKPILEGLRDAGFPDDRIYVASSLFDANDWLRTYLGPGDVVLYENDLPDTYEG